MEFSSRAVFAYGLVILALAVHPSWAGTSVSSGKQLLSSGAASINQAVETERGGWSYPTGYSWTSNAASFGLPLLLIPLIYFGFLWCVLLFGLSAFHHAPGLHGHGHGHGHGGHSLGGHGHSAGGGHGHHRYRRYDDFEDDYNSSVQQRVLSSI